MSQREIFILILVGVACITALLIVMLSLPWIAVALGL